MRGLAVSLVALGLPLTGCDRAPSGPIEQPSIRVEGPGTNATTANQAAPAPLPAGTDFPAWTGPVVDDAGLLSADEEAALTRISDNLYGRSTDQLVIVTLPSLNGARMEDYARALLVHWGVGRQRSDNGILLVVAPNERETRIEVGAGLDNILTSRQVQQIVDRDLVANFREGRWYQGLDAGTRSLAAILEASADLPRGTGTK